MSEIHVRAARPADEENVLELVRTEMEVQAIGDPREQRTPGQLEPPRCICQTREHLRRTAIELL